MDEVGQPLNSGELLNTNVWSQKIQMPYIIIIARYITESLYQLINLKTNLNNSGCTVRV